MRFEETGPNLPDELLYAADEGEVVFFCGAGVSRAEANLPDFTGLVKAVCAALKPLPAGPVGKILAAQDKLRDHDVFEDLPAEARGLISADRLFGLLEAEFGVEQVELEVARALKVPANVDLTAHETLLRLSTSSKGRTRLVTTNFDRLFESASRGKIPSIGRVNLNPDFNGLVKLHGSVSADGEGPEPPGFVLSTASFGGAYVAEGWAARFVRATLERNTVVFIGYAADDPPMQYLLEALQRIHGTVRRAYAFNLEDDTAVRWRSRGVKVLAHSDYPSLWRTVGLWSKRVADPDGWRAATTKQALSNPRDLTPLQRSQVVHLVTSTKGSKAFLTSDKAYPQAEWICVFDPRCRYGRPGSEAAQMLGGDATDPFQLYGLDTDQTPQVTDPNLGLGARDVPADALSPLSWTELDREELRSVETRQAYGAQPPDGLHGQYANLPPRLCDILIWLRMVAHEPATLWWAVRQSPLHPVFRDHLIHNLNRDRAFPSDAAQAWQTLLLVWDEASTPGRTENSNRMSGLSRARFQQDVKQLGWSSTMLRTFERATKPHIKLSPDYSAFPPRREVGISLRRLLRTSIEYDAQVAKLDVPDNWLMSAVAILRRHLERGVALEWESTGYLFETIPPIVRSDDPYATGYEYSENLGGMFYAYLGKLERLRDVDRLAFEAEIRLWPDEPFVFARLRIWLVLDATRSTSDEAFRLLSSLSDEAFWHQRHQRDLLHALKNRWSGFSVEEQRNLTDRMIAGRSHRWGREADAEYLLRRSWASLDMLWWLQDAGAALPVDWQAVSDELRQHAPEWNEGSGRSADVSFGSRSGTVRENDDPSALKSVPTEDVVEKSAELAGRTEDHMVEDRPFLGLVRHDFERAMDAIRLSKADAKTTAQALRDLLWETRERDELSVSRTVSELLMVIPDAVFADASHAIASWLAKLSESAEADLAIDQRNSILDRGIERLNDFQQTRSETSGRQPDWIFEAINAPAGRYVDVLMSAPDLPQGVPPTGLPGSWKQCAEHLLSLHAEHSVLALIRFCMNLPYLFYQDESWARQWLIPAFSDEHGPAVLAGLLGSHSHISPELFAAVKPALLEQLTVYDDDHSRAERGLAVRLFSAWLNEAGIEGSEFTELLASAAEGFREKVLWQCERLLREEAAETETRVRIRYLLTDLWPRQAALRTADQTRAMVRVALAAGDDFESFVTAVKGHLRPLPTWLPLYEFDDEEGLASKHPAAVLELISLIAPEHAVQPPYELSGILNQLVEALPELADDRQFTSLRGGLN